MAKKLHQYFNIKEPVNCSDCDAEIDSIHKCKVLVDTESIKKNPYDVEIDESNVKYFCLECCSKLNI